MGFNSFAIGALESEKSLAEYNENISSLANLIIKFFGEDKREAIVEKLNNSTFVFVKKFSGEGSLENRTAQSMKNALLSEFGNKTGIDLDDNSAENKLSFIPFLTKNKDKFVTDKLFLDTLIFVFNDEKLKALANKDFNELLNDEESKTLLSGYANKMPVIEQEFNKYYPLIHICSKKADSNKPGFDLEQYTNLIATDLFPKYGFKNFYSGKLYFGGEDLYNFFMQTNFENVPEDFKMKYESVFGEITGQTNKTYADFIDDKKFMEAIEGLKLDAHEYLEKFKKKFDSEISSQAECAGLDEVEKFLMSQEDCSAMVLKELKNYIQQNKAFAFYSSITKEDAIKKKSLIVVPSTAKANTQSHEICHMLSDNGDGKKGFENKNKNKLFNEVVTEFFAQLISAKIGEMTEEDKSKYTIAFPIFDELLMENLDQIKSWYLNSDVEALSDFFGEKEFESISKMTDELLSEEGSFNKDELKLKMQEVVKKIKNNIIEKKSESSPEQG